MLSSYFFAIHFAISPLTLYIQNQCIYAQGTIFKNRLFNIRKIFCPPNSSRIPIFDFLQDCLNPTIWGYPFLGARSPLAQGDPNPICIKIEGKLR